MCKVFIMSGIPTTKGKQKKAFDLIFEMAELMSKHNTDGLGYTLMDDKGRIGGERWLINKEAFKERIRPKEANEFSAVKSIVDKFKGVLESKDVYGNNEEKFDEFRVNKDVAMDTMTAITLHTRMATSEKTFKNVHPFVDANTKTSVIHNGVISNHAKSDEIRSTCDSERILNKYIEHRVMDSLDNIQKMFDELNGSMACGVFSSGLDGKPILDIFRNDRSRLSAGHIKELGIIAFTTDIDDLEKACKSAELTLESSFIVKPNKYLRLNPLTGEVVDTKAFTDYVYNYQSNSSYSGYNRERSGGYNLWDDGELYDSFGNYIPFNQRRLKELSPPAPKSEAEVNAKLNEVVNSQEATEERRAKMKQLIQDQNGWVYNSDGYWTKVC